MEKILSNSNDCFTNNLMKIIINIIEQKEIEIEEILENDFYFNDLINNQSSKFKILLTKENIKKIIKFCLFPEKNPEKSPRYSFYSFKILCSENGLLFNKSIQKIIENSNSNIGNNAIDKNSLDNYIYPNYLNNNYKNEIWYGFFEDFYLYLDTMEKLEKGKYVDLVSVQFNENQIQNQVINNSSINKYKEEEISFIMEIIDEIFKILDDDYDEIYIGYFQKLVNFLLLNESDIIIYYLFKDKISIIKKLYKHLNKLSIQNILENILNILSVHKDKFDKDHSKYSMIILDLIEELIRDKTLEKSEYICNLIINAVISNNEKQLFKLFFNNNILEKIKKIIEIKIQGESNDRIIIGITNLLIELNNSIMKSCNNKSFQNYKNDFILNKIKINMFEYKFFKKNIITVEILKYFNEVYWYLKILNEIYGMFIKDIKAKDINNKNFGLKYLYESKFILSALKIYIFSINELEKDINILDNQKYFYDEDLFEILFKFYFKYKNNNLYQNIIINIMKLICNEKCPIYLVDPFLNKKYVIMNQNKFISQLINSIIEKSNNKWNFLIMPSIRILNIIYESSNEYFLNHFQQYELDKEYKEIFINALKPKFEMKLDPENYDYSFSEIINSDNDSYGTFDGNDSNVKRQYESFSKTIIKYREKLGINFNNQN